jgi:hypothetical protein
MSTITAERQTAYAASLAAPLIGNGSAAHAGAANAITEARIKNAPKVRNIASFAEFSDPISLASLAQKNRREGARPSTVRQPKRAGPLAPFFTVIRF